jgi:hypothetical protein
MYQDASEAMSEKARLTSQIWSAWCGPAFFITFVVFWGFMGNNLPAPPPPGLTPQELAARCLASQDVMKYGFALSMVSVILYLPWSALLSAQLARIEGRYPVMAYLQLLGGGLTMMVVSIACVGWAVELFRPDRSPELMQLMNDFGWLGIDMQYGCTTMQILAAAYVGFMDRSPVRLFPFWFNIVQVIAAFSMVPASMVGIVQTGPFAWDGVWSYYFPYACWLFWFAVAGVYMLKDVYRRRGALLVAMAQSVPVGSSVRAG